ncbi:MAG: peptidase M23 [Methylotenera sp.]|nr:MAG: peptidase M23 [Methylotenera sp.]
MHHHCRFGLLWLLLTISACSTTPPAPVIDRAPTKPAVTPKPVVTPEAKPVVKPDDWRPDNYTVKKGDTLISIGLEYGYDYKEIAEANGLTAPYTIRIGQILNLGNLNDKTAAPPAADADGVVITPINQEAPVSISTPPKTVLTPGTSTSTTGTPTKPSIMVISEPKAISEPYSDEAYKKIVPGVKPVATAPASTVQPVADANAKDVGIDTKTNGKANPPEAGEIDWLWPTKGKVVGNFSESSNKGLDIAGVTGQSIQAAASGKVIYSGSDLRGYGKLVIIKHNKNYLSVYAHNSQILVKEGQQVNRGQKIAEMGNTDSSTVKLHFEIRHQGKSVDPAKYLAAN